jgi:hypothetical protein
MDCSGATSDRKKMRSTTAEAVRFSIEEFASRHSVRLHAARDFRRAHFFLCIARRNPRFVRQRNGRANNREGESLVARRVPLGTLRLRLRARLIYQ